MASSRPCSGPKTRTPIVATVAATMSLRRRNAYRRIDLKSSSPQTAWITIADSVALGRADRAGARNRIVARARTAVVSPETCERPPARSTVAVLDRLPATPKPPKIPELTLPTPTASSSWLASTRASSVAYSRAALRPSARPTNATAAPAMTT